MGNEEQPETLVVGKSYVLVRNLYCYQILTIDTRAQVFGTYSQRTAKEKFDLLEAAAKKNSQ